MSIETTLARAQTDIEHGDLGLARLRLQSLLDHYPETPEIRQQLARVCRLSGDLAAAGRYGFLTEDVEERELDAFARRHGGRPALMLRAIDFWDDASTLPPSARERLLGLQQRCDEEPPIEGVEVPHRAESPNSSRPGDWVFYGVAGLVLLVLGLGVFQAYQLVARAF